MKKKLLALLLTLTTMAVMAAPAMAAWVFTPYYVDKHSNNCLNIYGNVGAAMSNRSLTLYNTSSPGTDQKFTRVIGWTNGNKCQFYVVSQNNTQYAINRSTASANGGKNAIMWKLSGNEYDSAFRNINSDPATIGQLYNYTEWMRPTSDTSGANVYFSSSRYSWVVVDK